MPRDDAGSSERQPVDERRQVARERKNDYVVGEFPIESSADDTARFFAIFEMIMQNHEPVNLKRDVEAALVPAGTKVTLQKGEAAYITQTLGGSYTVVVNGNMFRVDGRD